jgi:hypothetical protein
MKYFCIVNISEIAFVFLSWLVYHVCLCKSTQKRRDFGHLLQGDNYICRVDFVDFFNSTALRWNESKQDSAYRFFSGTQMAENQ